jgi:hypothetical protein
VPRGTPLKTPERVAEARQLREQGYKLREIAAYFGVAIPTVQAWLADPSGTRLRGRKDALAQQRRCADCGAPTDGGRGPLDEARCKACSDRKRGIEMKIWTREAIVLAIEEWAAAWGEPPAVPDWNAWHSRHVLRDEQRAQRAEHERAAGRCPCITSVVKAFGSWNAAITAAGFEPRPTHGGSGNERRRRSVRERVSAVDAS